MSETILHEILSEIKQLKKSVSEIDEDLHRDVSPRYMEKLQRINKEEGRKFTKEELLRHLRHEI